MDYSELDQVLVFIRNKIQIYYDGSRRDSISDQIYPNSSQAPPPTTPGGRSSSFSQSTNNFSPPATGVGPNGEFIYSSKSVSESNIANDKAQPVLVYSTSPTKKKINTVTFEKADLTTSTFSFSKEKISTNTVQSSLTKLVKPNEEKQKDMWSSYGDFTPPPNEGITITVHIGVHGIKGLKVRVIKQATVGQCVAATLKTYMYPSAPNISIKAVPPSPPSPSHPTSAPPTPIPEKQISLDPKHYLFRIADESGNVDDDYPALDERQLVFKFKDENFILVPKIVPSAPAPSPVKPAETMKKSPVQTSSRGNSNSMINLDTGVALDANGAPLTHRRTSSASMDPPLLLKVRLPDNTSTKVIMQGNMKVGDLLRHVCRKRQLNLDAHTLVLPRSLDPLELDTILNKLSSDEFMLCPSFLHSPSTASPKLRSHTGPSTPRAAAPINPILPAPTLSNAPVTTPRPTSPSKNNSSNIVYAITSLRTSLSKSNVPVSAKVAATVASNGTPNLPRTISMRSSSSLTLSTTNSSATILGTSASSVSLGRPQNREDDNNNTLVPPTSPLIAVSQDSPTKQIENEVQENSNTSTTENTNTENKELNSPTSPTKSPQKSSQNETPNLTESTNNLNIAQKENVDETNISVKVTPKPTPNIETNGILRESKTTYGNIHSYTVYRLRKKQTVKKERTLSFNLEKIYNEKVSSKKESFNENEEHKTRNIKNITKVALSEKPGQFSIVYDDSKAYFYEAKEHSTAEEIVQKLNELITTSTTSQQ